MHSHAGLGNEIMSSVRLQAGSYLVRSSVLRKRSAFGCWPVLTMAGSPRRSCRATLAAQGLAMTGLLGLGNGAGSSGNVYNKRTPDKPAAAAPVFNFLSNVANM
jgi:hypothetical protein